MKVKQLKKALEKCSDDAEVFVFDGIFHYFKVSRIVFNDDHIEIISKPLGNYIDEYSME